MTERSEFQEEETTRSIIKSHHLALSSLSCLPAWGEGEEAAGAGSTA